MSTPLLVERRIAEIATLLMLDDIDAVHWPKETSEWDKLADEFKEELREAVEHCWQRFLCFHTDSVVYKRVTKRVAHAEGEDDAGG